MTNEKVFAPPKAPPKLIGSPLELLPPVPGWAGSTRPVLPAGCVACVGSTGAAAAVALLFVGCTPKVKVEGVDGRGYVAVGALLPVRGESATQSCIDTISNSHTNTFVCGCVGVCACVEHVSVCARVSCMCVCVCPIPCCSADRSVFTMSRQLGSTSDSRAVF